MVKFPDHLLYQLQSGQVFMVVGPGVGREIGLPDELELTNALAKDLDVSLGSLPELLELYSLELGKDSLRSFLGRLLAAPNTNTPYGPTLEALVRTPCKLFLTTCLDQGLEKALEAASIPCRVQVPGSNSFTLPPEESPDTLVYHLAGLVAGAGQPILTASEQERLWGPEGDIDRLLRAMIHRKLTPLVVGFNPLHNEETSRFLPYLSQTEPIYWLSPLAVSKTNRSLLVARKVELVEGESLAQLATALRKQSAHASHKPPPGGAINAVRRQEILKDLVAEFRLLRPAAALFPALSPEKIKHLEIKDIFISRRLRRMAPQAAPSQERDQRDKQNQNNRLRNDSNKASFHSPNDGDSKEEQDERATFELVPGPEVALENLLGQGPFLMVLGGPASGKTTLLRYLAHEAQQRLLEKNSITDQAFPVFIRLLEVPPLMQSQGSLGRALARLAPRYNPGLTEPEAWHLLSQGRCLLFMDGLDEIVSNRERNQVLEAMNKDLVGKGHQVVASSRPLAFSARRGGPAAFSIDPLAPGERKEFLEKWHRVSPGSGSVEQRTAKAITELDKHEPLTDVLRLPLVLAMAATLLYRHESLPQGRALFYEQSVRLLAERWQMYKGQTPGLDFPELEQTLVALGPVAWQLHQEREDSVAEELLREQVAQSFQQSLAYTQTAAESSARSFIACLRTQGALFCEVAPGRFGFIHRSFQEFFAARHLAQPPNRLTRLEFLARLQVLSPHWAEVVEFLFGLMGPLGFPASSNTSPRFMGKEEFLEALDRLKALDSPLEAKTGTRQGLLLRGLAAAGTRTWDNDNQLNSQVEGQIKAGLNCLGLFWQDLPVLRALSSLAELPWVSHILTQKMTCEPSIVRASAAQALATQAGENSVLQALLKKLEDEDSDVRASAAQALATQAGENSVLQALLKKLEDEDSEKTGG